MILHPTKPPRLKPLTQGNLECTALAINLSIDAELSDSSSGLFFGKPRNMGSAEADFTLLGLNSCEIILSYDNEGSWSQKSQILSINVKNSAPD